MKSLMLGAALLTGAACGQAPAAVRVGATTAPEPSTSTSTEAPATTTTEPAPATTTSVYKRTAPVTTRRTTTTARPTQTAPVVHGADFWYRLATCESGNGRGSANQFQFMGGTAEKVGYYPGSSYEEQRAMAVDWASRIHPNEGTTAGWPECWWIAGGS